MLDLVIGRWLDAPSTAVFDPRFGIVQPPHARVVQSGEGWSIAHTNALGFFDDELRVPRPRVRVLLLGDSYAEGLQMSHAENFSTVAERALSGVEIVNAAGSGRFLAHYAAFLPGTWQAVQPDLLVIAVNDTDVGELGEPALLEEVRDEVAGRSAEWNAHPAPTPANRFRALLRRSALLKLAFVRANLLARYERDRFARKFAPRGTPLDTTQVRPRAVTVADSLMDAIVRVVPRPILLYTPNLDYFADPPAAYAPERRMFWRALAARHGVEIIDPTDSLLAAWHRDRVFLHGFANTAIGDGHLNARGHALVGRLLAERLAERTR